MGQENQRSSPLSTLLPETHQRFPDALPIHSQPRALCGHRINEETLQRTTDCPRKDLYIRRSPLIIRMKFLAIALGCAGIVLAAVSLPSRAQQIFQAGPRGCPFGTSRTGDYCRAQKGIQYIPVGPSGGCPFGTSRSGDFCQVREQ